jgi:hypothetical protein
MMKKFLMLLAGVVLALSFGTSAEACWYPGKRLVQHLACNAGCKTGCNDGCRRCHRSRACNTCNTCVTTNAYATQAPQPTQAYYGPPAKQVQVPGR